MSVGWVGHRLRAVTAPAEAHPSPPAVAQVFFAFLGSPRDLQL